MTLDHDDIEAIARRVVELQEERRPSAALGLVDADRLAAELGVDVGWVYANGARLGRIKLGEGRNAPVRFDLQHVRSVLRGDPATGSSVPPPRRAAPARRGSSTFPLLTPRKGL